MHYGIGEYLTEISSDFFDVSNHLQTLHSKSIDWFLYEGNTGTSWVKQIYDN